MCVCADNYMYTRAPYNNMTLYMYMYMYVYPLLHACISLCNTLLTNSKTDGGEGDLMGMYQIEGGRGGNPQGLSPLKGLPAHMICTV